MNGSIAAANASMQRAHLLGLKQAAREAELEANKNAVAQVLAAPALHGAVVGADAVFGGASASTSRSSCLSTTLCRFANCSELGNP
jgi:hypothetical protein